MTSHMLIGHLVTLLMNEWPVHIFFFLVACLVLIYL